MQNLKILTVSAIITLAQINISLAGATVEELVDSISQKLLTKELNFSSPAPHELYEVFQEGVVRCEAILLKNDPSRLENLTKLKEKGAELFSQQKLNSRWLLALNVKVADLISFEDEDSGLYAFLEEETLEKSFHHFAEFQDHWSERKKLLTDWEQMDWVKNLYAKKFKRPLEKYDVLETYRYSDRIEYAIEHFDCFWLPVMTDEPIFKIETLNKAYAHRIGLVGVPFKDTAFDGGDPRTPKEFTQHDIRCHPFIFEGPEPIDQLDLTTDSFIRFWNGLWNAMQTNATKDTDEFVYFSLFHEGGPDLFEQPFDWNNRPLKEIIEHQLSELKTTSLLNLTNPQAFWESVVKEAGIENVESISFADAEDYMHEEADATSMHIVIKVQGQEKPLENFEPDFFVVSLNHTKELLYNDISYFRSIGINLPEGLEDQPDRGKIFYEFLEKAYLDFLAKFGDRF